jgi:hypothetical protein
MDKVKILVQVEVSADPRYCERCDWKENCPPGCRFFKTALRLCLGGGVLRCEECLQAESDTKGGKQKEGV